MSVVKSSVLSMVSVIVFCFVFSVASFAQVDSVYVNVDKVPVLKSHRGDVQKALNKRLQYPFVDLMAKREGVVQLSFIIDSKGAINDIKVEETLSASLDKEAIRAIGSLEKWKPGKVNGNDVNTRLILPVHFKISEAQYALIEQLQPIYQKGKNPLFILDNQKVIGVGNVEYYNVKSIRVIKGEKAISLYGEDAMDGAVVIQTKRGTYPQYQMY